MSCSAHSLQTPFVLVLSRHNRTRQTKSGVVLVGGQGISRPRAANAAANGGGGRQGKTCKGPRKDESWGRDALGHSLRRKTGGLPMRRRYTVAAGVVIKKPPLKIRVRQTGEVLVIYWEYLGANRGRRRGFYRSVMEQNNRDLTVADEQMKWQRRRRVVRFHGHFLLFKMEETGCGMLTTPKRTLPGLRTRGGSTFCLGHPGPCQPFRCSSRSTLAPGQANNLRLPIRYTIVGLYSCIFGIICIAIFSLIIFIP